MEEQILDVLTKKEYQILYYISRGRNSFDRLKKVSDRKTAEKALSKLESLGLVKISYAKGEIDGFRSTEGGDKLLESEEYFEWFEECGG